MQYNSLQTAKYRLLSKQKKTTQQGGSLKAEMLQESLMAYTQQESQLEV